MKVIKIRVISSIVFLLIVSGMNAYANESDMKKIKVVRSYFVDALDGKQADLTFLLFAKDAEQHFNGYLHNVGAEEIHKNTMGAKKIFTTFHTDIHEITVKDKMVYAYITHTAVCIDSTVSGFPGGPVHFPTRVGPMVLKGQKVQWQAMALFEFNSSGQIQKEWIVRDELGMLLTAGTLKFSNP